jgi:glucose-1-phosphate thymidylyltransferase
MFAITGLYLYDRKVFSYIRDLKPSHRGELEITDVNNQYAHQHDLTYEVLKGYWSDAGTFDSLHEAGNLVRSNK